MLGLSTFWWVIGAYVAGALTGATAWAWIKARAAKVGIKGPGA